MRFLTAFRGGERGKPREKEKDIKERRGLKRALPHRPRKFRSRGNIDVRFRNPLKGGGKELPVFPQRGGGKYVSFFCRVELRITFVLWSKGSPI